MAVLLPTHTITRQRAGTADITGIRVMISWPVNPTQPDATFGQRVDAYLTADPDADITYGDTIVITAADGFSTLRGPTVYQVTGIQEHGGLLPVLVCNLAGAA